MVCSLPSQLGHPDRSATELLGFLMHTRLLDLRDLDEYDHSFSALASCNGSFSYFSTMWMQSHKEIKEPISALWQIWWTPQDWHKRKEYMGQPSTAVTPVALSIDLE